MHRLRRGFGACDFTSILMIKPRNQNNVETLRTQPVVFHLWFSLFHSTIVRISCGKRARFHSKYHRRQPRLERLGATSVGAFYKHISSSMQHAAQTPGATGYKHGRSPQNNSLVATRGPRAWTQLLSCTAISERSDFAHISSLRRQSVPTGGHGEPATVPDAAHAV